MQYLYICRDKRNRDVLPENGYFIYKLRGVVSSDHFLPPSCNCQYKAFSDNYRPEGSIFMNKNPRKQLVQDKLSDKLPNIPWSLIKLNNTG